MFCLRNIRVDNLHKGDIDDDDNHNNNINNELMMVYLLSRGQDKQFNRAGLDYKQTVVEVIVTEHSGHRPICSV
jgi:hypothetical protein